MVRCHGTEIPPKASPTITSNPPSGKAPQGESGVSDPDLLDAAWIQSQPLYGDVHQAAIELQDRAGAPGTHHLAAEAV